MASTTSASAMKTRVKADLSTVQYLRGNDTLFTTMVANAVESAFAHVIGKFRWYIHEAGDTPPADPSTASVTNDLDQMIYCLAMANCLTLVGALGRVKSYMEMYTILSNELWAASKGGSS